MSTQPVIVRQSLRSQGDLRRNAEHCSADPALLAAVGAAKDRQVRIRRSDDEFALFTVSELRDETPDREVRIGLVGRRRLGTDEEFDGVVDTQVPHPTATEAQAREDGELVERLDDDGAHTGLIVIAPHGGHIERRTDEQAERVAERLADLGVSCWRCKGWKPGGGAFDRWHITSTELDEACFPRLASVMGRGFTHAVAFHGFDEDLVLIGGRAGLELKHEIAGAILAATAGSALEVRVAGPDDVFGGDDEDNIVNRLTAGGDNGVQIEQAFRAREHFGIAIADAVAAVYAHWLAPGGDGSGDG